MAKAEVAATKSGRRRGAVPGAGRVVAGSARGLRLEAPPDARPMGDRLKEAVFAILEPELRDRGFLDLFAGSGAGSVEALSRGAATAILVERDPAALAVINRNLAATRLADRATIRRGDALEWLKQSASADGPFDVILADPPYDDPRLLEQTLAAISKAGPGRILAEAGVVAAKHARQTRPPGRIGLLASVRDRRFGESTVTFLRWAPEQETA
jgi:16S rRNA (guanine966-N2)-methyltransferase